MMTDDDHHKIFLKRLEGSRTAVWVAAAWLHKRGWSVAIPAIQHGPKRSDWKKFSDNGDILAWSPGSKERHRFEVKGIGFPFTCRKDWPFRDKYLICSKHSFDKVDPKPTMYINVAPDFVHLGLVSGASCNAWHFSEWADKEHPGINTEKYWCDTDLVTFTTINNVERLDLHLRVPQAAAREQDHPAEQDAQVPQQAADDQRGQVRQHQGGEQARRAEADGKGRGDRAPRAPDAFPTHPSPGA
jgi:hypothetical protein